MADRQLLLGKAETTYGVDPVAAAANAIRAENVRFTPKGQRVAGSVAKPGVGPVKGYVYGEHGELSFDVPLAPSGVAGTVPKWGFLMLPCGFKETIAAGVSVTYALENDPSGVGSVALSWREGRRLHSLLGSRGRVGLKVSAGQRPMLSFMFRGLYTPVAQGAALVPADATWTGWNDVDPVAQGFTTCAYNAVNVPLRELSLDQSDNVKFQDLPHQENVLLLGDRSWTGRLKGNTVLPGSLNLETLWQNEGLQTLALVHGTTAGSIVTVNAKAQNDEPSYADDAGQDTFDVGLRLHPSALNLDDELSIVLT